jgi:hypothetical protein
VTVFSFLAMLPLLLGLAGSASPEAGAQAGQPQTSVQRLVVERQWILRVPVRPRPVLQRISWAEGKRFKCVRTNAIRGAMLAGPDRVDFVLGRERIRATLDGSCGALDFYGGFYLKTDDDRVCAQRDSLHSRMGGSCRIEQFHRLVAKIKG